MFTRRLAVLLALSSAFGFAAGHFTHRKPLLTHDDFAHPDTIEVYRPATATLPEVADTIRFDRDADRPKWVVRIKYGPRVVEYRGEAVNHPPQ